MSGVDSSSGSREGVDNQREESPCGQTLTVIESWNKKHNIDEKKGRRLKKFVFSQTDEI